MRDDLKRGGDRDTDPTRRRIFLHPFSGAKEKCQSQTSQKPQFFHQCPTLQDGRNPHTQKPTQKRRLTCKNRLEGHLQCFAEILPPGQSARHANSDALCVSLTHLESFSLSHA